MPPVIDKNRCNGCGKCVEICEGDAFYGSKEGQSVTYPEECWHDGNCILACPIEGAIRLRTPLPMMISYK